MATSAWRTVPSVVSVSARDAKATTVSVGTTASAQNAGKTAVSSFERLNT